MVNQQLSRFNCCTAEAQQWQLALNLAGSGRPNAISRSTAAAACGAAGQMRLLKELLQQLEEESDGFFLRENKNVLFF